MTAAKIKKKLRSVASAHRKAMNMRFFKTGKGEYGEGDKFLGVSVPQCRNIVAEFWQMPLDHTIKLVQSPYHEERLVGLLILVEKYNRASSEEKVNVYKVYVNHLSYVNNWDLVDTSVPAVVGHYHFSRNKAQLTKWARSENLWERRVAILATFYFIRQGQFKETIRISKILLNDSHDLIHKAVGWMLREVGKKDIVVAREFLDKYATHMPRTMLRYAIERFPENQRQAYLKKK